MGDKKEDKSFTFMTEKIKDKPVNKRKILLRLLYTVGLAAAFGIVASIVYVMGIHHMEDVLYPQKTEPVTISDNEEMVSENESVSEESTVLEPDEDEQPPEQVINNIVEKVDLTVEDYEQLYASLREIAKTAEASVVTVTGVRSDTDWFQNTYENKNQGSGLIIAENGKELLILMNKSLAENAQTIDVQFADDTMAQAKLNKYDSNTGLAIVGVELDNISASTKEKIAAAKLGNSSAPSLVGKNVIAIGSPMGIQNSISYGFVTSNTTLKQMTDTDVHILTTDIYGSRNAGGVLINLKGEVLGIITQSYADNSAQNLISALAISDLKSSIERMSNGQDKAMLGIYGTDVTESAMKELGIPKGAYVTEIVMDSPAMQSGIQSGDVIVKIGTTDITSFSEYKSAIEKSHPGDMTVVTVMRFAKGEYAEMNFEVTLGNLD